MTKPATPIDAPELDPDARNITPDPRTVVIIGGVVYDGEEGL